MGSDFSGIVSYPHDISDDVIETLSDFHDYGDASAHVRAFGQLIDDWLDPPIYGGCSNDIIYEDDWFHDSEDNTFKTIRDLLLAFLERFGDDHDETYNELVDAFMEKLRK